MTQARLSKLLTLGGVLCGVAFCVPASAATDCKKTIDRFNLAVDAGLENDAQVEIDKIAVSAECGQFQLAAQRRLTAHVLLLPVGLRPATTRKSTAAPR